MAGSRSVSKAKKSKKPSAEQEESKWLDLFSIFIHDLESPLASMKYILKLLEEKRLDLDKPLHRRMVESSNIAVQRAESILYDIMAVARSQTAGLPINMTSLVPEVIIKESILLAAGSANENNNEITFTNNAGSTAVGADPQLLKRVLDNLIFNAIRHTPSGRTVAIYTEPTEESVFIHVKDSGQGLGDIDTSKLFDKYGQAELRQEKKHRGVGLGLYFCRLAATGMGGTIIADDHPVGGAVFSIRLKKI